MINLRSSGVIRGQIPGDPGRGNSRVYHFLLNNNNFLRHLYMQLVHMQMQNRIYNKLGIQDLKINSLLSSATII